MFVDDGGSVLVEALGTIALLDDRDLARVADQAARFPTVVAAAVAPKYSFVPEPRP